jgi:hypothetical protein
MHPQFTTAPPATQSPLLCDFCSEPEPSWVYPCRDIVLIPLDAPPEEKSYVSEGDWLACDGCSPFIERGDWTGLIDRNAPLLAERTNTPPLTANRRGVLMATWAMFGTHRGERRVRHREGS